MYNRLVAFLAFLDWSERHLSGPSELAVKWKAGCTWGNSGFQQQGGYEAPWSG